MTNLPPNSLLKTYLPADHTDSQSRLMICEKALTPNELLDFTFRNVPKWIDRLMKLRNTIVKPLGLDTESQFTEKILAQNSNELVFGMPDKHLSFYVSLWCSDYKEGKQEVRITTLIKYHNTFGRLYFFVIRPFHGVLTRSLLKFKTN